MLILAFDAALQATQVAVWRNGEVLARAEERLSRGQAERLMPMITDAMAAAAVDFKSLDRIAVTCGPGSFTGVRIGLAAARGLALATGRPAIGISTTEVLAASVADDERRGVDGMLAVIDSQRGDLFAQLFDAAGAALGPVVNVSPDALRALVGERSVLTVGDGCEMAARGLTSAMRSRASAICDVSVLAGLAAKRGVDPAGPLPIYVRPPDVTMGPGSRALRS